MARVNYRKEIEQSSEILLKFRQSKELFGKEEEILELLQFRYKIMWSQVHEVLAEKKTEESESEIQSIIRDVVRYDLPIAEIKIKNFEQWIEAYEKRKDKNNVNLCYQYLQKWLVLYEKLFALVAFRSLEHYARFWEWDFEDSKKIFKYSLDPFGDGGYTGVNKPFLYYANQMVLQKNRKVITKQYPTGYGKSVSDVVFMTWALGVDTDNDFLKVLGNPKLIIDCAKGIVDTMTRKRYAMVFPKFAKYFEEGVDPKTMFSEARLKDGELTLEFNKRSKSVTIISKDTPVDGIRVKFLLLDDVCRSKDANNMTQHQKDIDNYWNSWWKRNYNTEDFYVILSGTAYSIYDILSTLKRYYSKGKVKRSDISKYTTLSLDDKAVFISIPKLDPDTDESTYPQKFPTEEARAIRDRDYRSFMAMEQQQPLEPENSPFYWSNLTTYETIPEEERSEFCWASLDPARVGFDNVAMAIFVKAGEKHYLKDCIYRNEPMEKLHQLIVDKIKQHKITKFVIERNTDTSLKTLLDKMLNEQGVHFCQIIEIYATRKKEERIYEMENTIKMDLVFPCENLFARSSEIGKFMIDLIAYRYDGKNEHDDSIDAVATYCEKFIVKPVQNAKAKILYV